MHMNSCLSHLHALGVKDRGVNDTFSQKKLRSVIIELAWLAKVEECIAKVQQMVQNTTNPFRELDVNTRDAICCATLRYNQAVIFLALVHQLQRKRRQSIGERQFYIRCLPYLLAYIEQTDPAPNDPGGLSGEEVRLAQQYAIENVDYKGVQQFQRFVQDEFKFAYERPRAINALKGWMQVITMHARPGPIDVNNFKELAVQLVRTKHLTETYQDELLVVVQTSIDIYRAFRGYFSPRQPSHIIN